MIEFEKYLESLKDKNRVVKAFSFFPTTLSSSEIIWFKFYYKFQVPYKPYQWYNRVGHTDYNHYWKTIKRSKTNGFRTR